MKKTAIERILSKIEILPESGCWIFMGALNESGYGIVGLGARADGVDRAHRITYRHFVGVIPNGIFVCHKCDVPSCCNPSHLFLGGAKENTQDMISKGRGATPPKNPHDIGSYRYNSKLTEERVKYLRSLRDSGQLTAYRIWKNLDAEFGISWGVVQRMLDRISWRHVL